MANERPQYMVIGPFQLLVAQKSVGRLGAKASWALTLARLKEHR